MGKYKLMVGKPGRYGGHYRPRQRRRKKSGRRLNTTAGRRHLNITKLFNIEGKGHACGKLETKLYISLLKTVFLTSWAFAVIQTVKHVSCIVAVP